MSISAIKYPSINAKLKGMYAKRLKNDDLQDLAKQNNLKSAVAILKNKSSSSLTKWSHYFTGWKNTKSGDPIDYSYAKEFELNKNWN